jgi:hypothetical protein
LGNLNRRAISVFKIIMFLFGSVKIYSQEEHISKLNAFYWGKILLRLT